MVTHFLLKRVVDNVCLTSKVRLLLVFLFQRVKVYRMNDDGKWDDQGTGHVTVDYVEVRFIFV